MADEPTSPLFNAELADKYAKVLGAHPIFTTRPNIAAALAQVDPDRSTLEIVGGFLQSLELSKQVRLARTGGAKLVLSDQDRAYLSMLGEDFNDVDTAPVLQQAAAQQAQGAAPAQTANAAGLQIPEHHGFFGAIAGVAQGAAHLAANATELPGVHQGLSALSAAGDATRGLLRIPGAELALGPVGLALDVANGNPFDDVAESSAGMRDRGYNQSNPLDVLAFYAKGKQNYHDLTDLRKEFGPDQVRLAQQYLEEPGSFEITPDQTNEQIEAQVTATNDPRWKELVAKVDSRHMSAGRDLARAVNADPTSTHFKLLSGSIDALESWFIDPTVIGGKVAQASKLSKLRINSLVDEQGIRRVMGSNASVRRGWQLMLDDAKTIRTGTPAEQGAAYAALRSRSPELVPLVDEINGKMQVIVNRTAPLAKGVSGPERLVSSSVEFTHQAPIENLDDLTEYLVNKDALVRALRGHTPKTGVYMPGSVSRFGATKSGLVEKAALRAGQSHEARIIDLSQDAAKVLPTPGDAVGGAMATSQARGEAIGKAERTARGRALRLARRMSSLAPNQVSMDYYSPAATDMVYKWAAAAMPKAEARAVAARFSAADLAGRRTIRLSMAEQFIHAAGLESSATGRELAAKMRGDLVKADSQTFSLADDADLLTDAAGSRHVAVFPGQLSTEMWLPSFVEMQRAGAKVSLYDYTLRRVADSVVTEKIMQTLRAGWITTSGGALRNVIDNLAGATASGAGGDTFKAKLSLAQARNARALQRELPAGAAPFTSEAGYHKARIRRVFTGIHKTKASALAHVTSEEFDEGARILGEEIAQGHMATFGLNTSALITGVADPHSLEDVAEITRMGARPAEIAFKQWEQKGWGEVASDGESGARNWAHNLDQVVGETPILGQRLVAALRKSPTGEELDKLVAGTSEVQALSKSIEKMGAGLDRVEPTINKVADAVTSFGKNKGAAERWNHANAARDLNDVETLKDIREAVAYLRQRSAQTLEDPKLQRAAKRHTPGAKDAMEASKRRHLTTLIDKTSVLDDVVRQIDEHLTRVSDLSAAKKAAASATRDRDYEAELVNHILDHPELDRFREFSELAAPLKTAETREQARELAHSIADRMVRSFEALTTGKDGQPIHQLLDRLESGQVPSLEWFAEHVPSKIRPEHLIGRQWAPVAANPEATGLLGLGQMLGRGYTAFLSKSYQTVVTGPITRMSSHPIFLGNFVKARRNLAGYEEHLVNNGLSAEAAKLHSTKLALDHAMDMTSRMIDNPEVASQMATISRNMVNFPRAAEDWVRRWSRIVKEDPTVIRKVQMAFEGGQHSGFIDRDSQGNLIFTYPGSGAAINAMLHVGEFLRIPHVVSIPTVPDLKTQVLFLNPSLNNPFFPGASPLVVTPIKVAEGLFPESKLMLQDLQTGLTGDDRGAGQGIMAQFFPSVVKNMFKSLAADEQSAQLSSAMKNAAVHLDAAGLGPDAIAAKEGRIPSAQEREDYLARIRVAARNQLVLRSIFAFALPATPSIPENDVSGDSSASDALFQAQGISTLKDEMHVLVSKLGYERALAVWTKIHPDELAYTVSGSKNEAPYSSVPVTRGAELWLEENRDFVTKYPKLAAYFIPDSPGDFSPEAYRAQLELGIRSRKGLEEFYGDVRTISAERTYYEVRDRRDREIAKAKAAGDSEGVARAKAIWSSWAQGDGVEPGFLKLNPLFAEKLASYGERTVWREQAVGDLEKMVNEGALGDGSGPGSDTVKLGKTGRVPVDAATAAGITGLIQAYRNHTAFTDRMRGRRDKDALLAKDNEQRAYDAHMLGITGASYNAEGRLTGGKPALRDVYQGLFRGLD